MKFKTDRSLWIAALAIFLFTANAFSQADTAKKPQKMDGEQLLEKHLASIGTAQDLAKINSIVLVGNGLLTSTADIVLKLSGPVQIASADERYLFAMMFDVSEYPYEKFAFDGSGITFGEHSGPNSRYLTFLKSNKGVIKRGLMGGVLNCGWPLRKLEKGERLSYDGTTKINGALYHKAKFIASGLGDLTVTLFFEDETFRHVQTEYKFISPGLISYSPQGIASGGTDQPRYLTLIESFANFTKVGDLILPLSYQIQYTADSAGKPTEWRIDLKEAYFNEALADSVFKVL